MATMNPVELYHDPALDDLIHQANSSQQNGPSKRKHTRTGSRSVSDDQGRMRQPYGNASRSAPGPYRGVGPNPDPGLHRSFSQRAPGRPFAEEAYRDDDELAEQKPIASSLPPLRPIPVQRPIAIETPVRKSSKREGQQRRYSRGGDDQTDAGTGTGRQLRGLPQSQLRTVSIDASIAPYKNREQPTNPESQTGKWAHDRSPLQKLEVKLTDISKEEKRARVQEAELKLLRDKKLGRAPERSRRADLASTSKAPTGVMPSLPITSRGRQVDASTSPEDFLKKEPPATSLQATQKPTSAKEPHPQVKVNQDQRTQDRQKIPSVQPPANTGIQVARAVSLQQEKPRVTYRREDRPVTQRERSASHQAALEQLTGTKSGNERSTSNPVPKSVPIVKGAEEDDGGSLGSPIKVDLSSMAGGGLGGPGYQGPQRTAPKATALRQNPSTTVDPGLGLQNPSALRSIDSPPASLKDVSKQRQRKSSVSFKEPFDRRRPVDEWKGAITAVLTRDEFELDSVVPVAVKPESDDLNTPWWEKDPSSAQQAKKARETTTVAQPAQVVDDRTAQFSPRLYIKCGPLLRYCGLRRSHDDAKPEDSEREFWRGSIMIVTQDSQCSYEEFPTLRLFSQPKTLLPPPPALVQGNQLAPEYIDPIAGLTKLGRTGKALYVRPVDHLDVEKDVSRIEDDNGIYESSPSPLDGANGKDTTSASTNKRTSDEDGERLGRFKEVKGVRIYADPDRDVTFWRFNLEVELGSTQQHIGYRINKGAAMGFWVPAKGQSMNIMFHSCNGFSLAVNPDEFSGPDPLWRDVLNNHQTRPFHVMIGGGDQIYNDRVMVDTHWFSGWTKIKNPHAKHQAPFTNDMKEELESFYLERYCMWFSQGLFALAGASIPMVNIWDDHDIIDGFGSYPHDFMKTPVFSGLGNIAHKYYMLFQHQSIDAMTEKDEPSWLLGHAPGPYIHAKSRSVFLELGQHIAFLGIDCRTERTKNDVMSIDTLEIILDRCRRDMVEGRTKHLIVLLGVPIAYPRLVWLENVLTSRAIEPLKALGRAGILKPGLLNKFDGGVEILDDLDDHWTASHHKDERNVLVQELQDLAAEKSARITILSGDVHLAAIGQFYSNPKLKIPKDKDHRYMPNVISSAIVNTPPPDMMADVLNRRNKIHHLDKYTDENMIPMFTHDVDRSKRNNNHLLPRRNWCSIREYHPGQTPPPSPSVHSVMTEDYPSVEQAGDEWSLDQPPKRRLSIGRGDLNPINLVRRFSSRKAPPSAYRTDGSRPPQTRSASFDGTTPYGQQGQRLAPSRSLKASSADHIHDVKALRPSFHRRPTNLAERAARKGIVPAIDAEGNEIDVNDHINLEGGLDIVINCEVDRKDPSGITLPYRFLVPALWYDGSSDREKLDEVVKPSRRATVLSKFGLGVRPAYRTVDPLADHEAVDDYSGTESYDDEIRQEKPFRSFSLFGSRKKKVYQYPAEDDHVIQSGDRQYPADGIPQDQPQPFTQQRSQQMGVGPPDVRNHQQPIPIPPTMSQQPYPPTSTVDQVSGPQPQASKKSRPLSFTMTKRNPAPNQIPAVLPQEQFFSSAPYDADASYVNQQQAATTPAHIDYGHQSARPARSMSKQEQVLGIGASSGNIENPHQRQLRGNGILGKNMPPTSFRADDDSRRPDSSSSDSAPGRGYSGIEAYREPKQKRRWSLNLRDRARGLMDSIDGRNTRHRDDLYSDDEEEEFWEGPRQQHGQLQERDMPPPAHAPQQPQRTQSQRERPTSGNWDRGLRQWGPVYSYDKGRVYQADQPQQAEQTRLY